MILRSERTRTNVADDSASKTEIKTVQDFLRIVKQGDVKRVEIEVLTAYHSHIIETGNQFNIYDNRGLRLQEISSAIIKCTLFHLSSNKELAGTQDSRVCTIVLS